MRDRAQDALQALLVVLAMAAVSPPAQAAAPSDGPERTVTIGPEYAAGGFHRWIWGDDYRALWVTPIRVPVLDLRTMAGGLEPVRRVGGQETKGLAFKGKDGRSYTFRGIDKDPTTILPEELQDTWARDLVQDQIAANHPASFFVVDELLKAARILRTDQLLVVMPDDPALGKFQKDFAGVVGQFFEFPQAKGADTPGFQDAVEILSHEKFYQRIQASPKDRPDARAFLKARLFDILVGDWDRHRDQWKWIKFADQPLWEPIPEDRDQAFSRFEGLALDLARGRVPILQVYKDHYPKMTGLTFNGWEQDRQLLAGLERPVWREVAAELKSQITDEVIERAARRMPPEYFQKDGARLIHDLKGRRDHLLEGADAFYGHIADKVHVVLTDAPEYVEVRRLAPHDTLVQVWERGPDGKPVGDPYFRRTLHRAETHEVQIALGGGDDRVVSVGAPNGISVRVIAGPGHDVVDDSAGGGSLLYSRGGAELVRGPGSSVHRREFHGPPPPKNAPWIPPRDWGRNTFFVPWLTYGNDYGLFVGAGVDTYTFGFRKTPYAGRNTFRAGWAFGESTFRADDRAEFILESSGLKLGWYAYASGIESSRFFGFGNDTTNAGSINFFKVKQQQYSFTPTLTVPLAPHVSFAFGPAVKYASNKHENEVTLVNLQKPYGFGAFGEVGATGLFEIDSRVAAYHTPGGVALRSMGYPRTGALLRVRGQVWPKAWDVKETFESLDGSAAAYLTPPGKGAPTLALRVGGKKVFGNYPYFEAAYLGGGLGGFGTTAEDEPLRGLSRHRYAGDSAVYGNADLRLPVSRMNIVLPGEWGLLGFGDAGRVYLAGESSNKMHYGFGAGVWFAWLDRSNTISASWARSEKHNAFYVRAGFAF